MDKKYLKYLQQFTDAGDKTEEIILKYYKRDFFILLSTILRLENISASKKKSIPVELAQNLVDIFKKPIIDEYKKYKRLQHKHKKLILSLATKKKHNFKYGNYSFSDFLDIHIAEIISKYEEVKNSNNKNQEMIIIVFNLLYKYLYGYQQKQQLSLYSYTVIVGIICVSFGLFDNEEKYNTLWAKDKTNAKSYAQYLHNCTKHLCERENKKQVKPIPKLQYTLKD